MAETVVAGMIVGESMADFCDSADGALNISTSLVEHFRQTTAATAGGIAGTGGNESAFAADATDAGDHDRQRGDFSRRERLQEAVTPCRTLQRRSRNIRLRSSAAGANPELVAAYRVQRMLKLAQCVAYGALQRTESRGAHFRADYPQRNDLEWMRRTLASWPDAEADLPTLNYEDLDIMRMELPPGWRGYGARDYIDHPDTAVGNSRLIHCWAS